MGRDDPKIVKLMIDYLYRLEYDDVLPSETPPAAEGPPSKEPDSPVAKTVKFFESIASNEASEPAENGPDSRVPWDYMLTGIGKRKKKKQMQLDGTWESRLTQDMIDEDKAAAEEFPTEEAIVEPVAEAEPEPPVPEPKAVIDVVEEWSFSSKNVPPTCNEKSRLRDFVPDPDTEKLVVNVDLYALADKYGIEDLKLLAKAKFSMAAEQNWKSEAFVRAAELAFRNTPSSDLGLRSVVISTLYKHRELTDYEEVQDLLDSGNGIAWRLVKALLSGSAASTVD